MIEMLDYGLQFLILLVCAAYSGVQAGRTRDRGWLMLVFIFSGFVMGNLYWLLCMALQGSTPKLHIISELSWYTTYIFLCLCLRLVQDGRTPARSWLAWLAPAFTAAAGLYFCRWGDYVGNLIVAILMGRLGFLTLQGLLEEDRPAVRRLARVIAAFFLMEYGMWFSSCIFSGDTLANPYFWFDGGLTFVMVLLTRSYGKAVAA